MESMNVFGVTESESRDAQENELAYDRAFKKVFCRKDVLAGILLNIVPEYKGLTHAQVQNLILITAYDNTIAEKLSEEENQNSKKTIRDIVVRCNVPERGIEDYVIYFDLEMQRKYDMEYPLIKRAIHYASCKLTSQLTSGKDYSKLCPVYSAWIALQGIPRELQNSTCSFRFQAKSSKAGPAVDKLEQEAQLLNIDFLLLSEKYDWDENDPVVIKFLQSIFKNKLNDRKFNPYIDADTELKKGVEDLMGRVGEYAHELEVEREQGLEQGLEQGRAEGLEQSILELVQRQMKKGKTFEEAVDLLDLNEEEIDLVRKSLEKDSFK